jgi:hypothetical protein
LTFISVALIGKIAPNGVQLSDVECSNMNCSKAIITAAAVASVIAAAVAAPLLVAGPSSIEKKGRKI